MADPTWARNPYGISPESEFREFPRPEGSKGSIREDLELIAEYEGLWEMERQDRPGRSTFDELPELLMDRFEPFIRKCEPLACARADSCGVEVDIGIDDEGDPVLTVWCPDQRFSSRKQAKEVEDHCLRNHETIRRDFANFVVGTAMDHLSHTADKIRRFLDENDE